MSLAFESTDPALFCIPRGVVLNPTTPGIRILYTYSVSSSQLLFSQLATHILHLREGQKGTSDSFKTHTHTQPHVGSSHERMNTADPQLKAKTRCKGWGRERNSLKT